MMTSTLSPQRELQGASAALALLQVVTNDAVFALPTLPLRPTLKGKRNVSCDICLGQNIQQKNSQLYHVKLTKEHVIKDAPTQSYKVSVHGTFTDFVCAKNAAYAALGLPIETFSSHHSRENFPDSDIWPYGDDVLVRAAAYTGETFTFSIHSESNHGDLIGDSHGEVCGTLYYAMQEVIRYGEDCNGGKRASRIRGVYSTRVAAMGCIERVLLDAEELQRSIITYEILPDLADPFQGVNTVVRAVAPNGDTYILSVIKTDRASKACGT